MKKLIVPMAAVGIALMGIGIMAQETPPGEESLPGQSVSSGMTVKLLPYHPHKTVQHSKTSLASAIEPETTAPTPALAPALKAATLKTDQSGFTIQLSSFLTEDEAKAEILKLKDRLAAEAADALWITTADVEGKTRYRVCIGHFKTMKEARSARPQIVEKSGIKEAFPQKYFSKLTARN